MSYIYKITNLVNGKEYIGQTSLSIQERFKQHIHDASKGYYNNRPLYNAINKYGVENFIIEKLEERSSQEVNQKEIEYINKFNTYSNGYNATLGGEGNSTIDYNKVLEEYQNGLTAGQIAKDMNHDIKQITRILKSNGISKEEIIKRGNDSQGCPLYQLNKKTNEILEKFDSVAKAAQYLKDNNVSKDTVGGISAHICQCCNGIRKTAYGFIWRYIK